MAIDSYSNLKTAIGDWLERDDLSSHIDDFIDIAESRHKREIRIREMLTDTELTLSEDSRTVSLPSDFLDHKYLRIQTPNSSYFRKYFPDVTQLTLHDLTLESVNVEGCPKFYAIHDEIEFERKADQDYTVELFYYKEVEALSDSNASNEILVRAPDIYLYASLLASAPFLMHDERINTWSQLYTDARDRLNSSQAEAKRGTPLVSRVAGATP